MQSKKRSDHKGGMTQNAEDAYNVREHHDARDTNEMACGVKFVTGMHKMHIEVEFAAERRKEE